MALDTTIGASNADSYATLAEYEARAVVMGWALADTNAANEINLRRAAISIDATYEWVGMKQYQFQARDWPRLVNQLVDGWPIDPDTVPQAIKNAQMEMAYLIQGGADPLATYTGGIKRQKVDVIEVEYAGASGRPRYDAVDRLLSGYVTAAPGQSVMVRA
jgi:hypothetical protein